MMHHRRWCGALLINMQEELIPVLQRCNCMLEDLRIAGGEQWVARLEEQCREKPTSCSKLAWGHTSGLAASRFASPQWVAKVEGKTTKLVTNNRGQQGQWGK